MLLKDKFNAGREGGRKRKKERYGDMGLARLVDSCAYWFLKCCGNTDQCSVLIWLVAIYVYHSLGSSEQEISFLLYWFY